MPAMEAMEAGTVVDVRYEIERALGEGGMGRLFLARDRTTKGSVALKVLRQDASPRDAERLVREAMILERIEHPAIVSHIGHGRTGDGTPYVAMEWLEGETLSERIAREGALPIEAAVALGRRLAGALDALHRAGLVHRDMKPDNVVLVGCELARATLVDFGLARSIVDAATKPGAIVGTPGYAAPEQARGRDDLDARVDVFSLGCLLFECLTGETPYPGSTQTTMFARVLFEDAPWVGDLRSEVPSSLAALVARMMSRERDARPRDGAAVVAAIDALSSDEPDRRVEARPSSKRASVVLARPHDSSSWPNETLDAIRTQLEGANARVEVLADRTLVAVAASEDHAKVAARCALALRELRPGVAIAVGSSASTKDDRALVTALEAAQNLVSPSADTEVGVAVDAVTAEMIGDRFDTISGSLGRLLVGERRATGPNDVREGAVLSERYVLERRIGQGGMGEVWSARHLALKSRVAVKLLHGALTSEEALRKRFLTEARVTAQLESANAVRVFDFGLTPTGQPYLVMELLGGEPLSARIAREGKLAAKTTVRFLRQAARALDRAHALGIVHRDLKPANMQVTRDDEGHEAIKIVDFGIAKLVGELDLEGGDPSSATDLRGSNTRTRGMLGTPAFMSPEQVRNDQRIGPKTDVWALGVVAFHCLTGRLPFEESSVTELFRTILSGQLPNAHAIESTLPNAFDQWFRRACALDPDDRFATAREAVATLATALGVDTESGEERIEHRDGTSPVDTSIAVEAIPVAPTKAGSRRTVIGLALLATIGIATLVVATRVPARKTDPAIASVPTSSESMVPSGPTSTSPSSPIELASTNAPVVSSAAPSASNVVVKTIPSLRPSASAKTAASASVVASAPPVASAIASSPAPAPSTSKSVGWLDSRQ